MECKRCHKAAEPKDLLEGICEKCIFDMGSRLRTLSKEELQKARAAVEAETAGLFQPAFLDHILDEFLADVENGEDPELARLKARNAIQKLAGVGMCQELMKLADGLADFAREMEDEARRKLQALQRLGPGGPEKA